jgi:hypothetical protein
LVETLDLALQLAALPLNNILSQSTKQKNHMNRIVEKLYEDKCVLATWWVGKSESYRDAAKLAKSSGHDDLSKFLRNRMRFWSLSAAYELKKIK